MHKKSRFSMVWMQTYISFGEDRWIQRHNSLSTLVGWLPMSKILSRKGDKRASVFFIVFFALITIFLVPSFSEFYIFRKRTTLRIFYKISNSNKVLIMHSYLKECLIIDLYEKKVTFFPSSSWHTCSSSGFISSTTFGLDLGASWNWSSCLLDLCTIF